MAGPSMFWVQKSRNGLTISAWKLVATGPSQVSCPHRTAKRPAVIDPPDTLEIRSSFGKYPNSFSRQRLPR